MNSNQSSRYDGPSASRPSSTGSLDTYLQIDLFKMIGWIAVRIRWIIVATLVCAAIAVAYSKLATPRYTANTDILMDPAGLQIVNTDLYRQNEQRDALLLNVESMRQTLVSGAVLRRAVEQLNLADDPEFVPPRPLIDFRAMLGMGERSDPGVVALERLRRHVTATRDQVSFVITLSVWSRDADKAVAISEAIYDGFRAELMEADSAGAERTAASLTDRIAELRAEVNAAEEAVEQFRRQNDLSASQGELVSSRSMSQINQQLVAARERLISAETRYRELQRGGPGSTAAMESDTLSALRVQYANLRQQVDAQSRVLGPRHPRLQSLRAELSALQGEIDAEHNRILLAAQDGVQRARAVVENLASAETNASQNVFSDNDAQVQLRELMREAAAKSAVYEAFLVRAREIGERQQLDTSNIRVISEPVKPRTRSWPPGTVMMAAFGSALGFVASTFVVVALGIVTELRDASVNQHRPEPRRVPQEPEPRRHGAVARREGAGREPRTLLDAWGGEGGDEATDAFGNESGGRASWQRAG